LNHEEPKEHEEELDRITGSTGNQPKLIFRRSC